MRRFKLWSLMVMITLLMAVVVPARAQAIWCHRWDFEIESGEADGISGDIGVLGYTAIWVDGNGWHGNVPTDYDRVFVEQTYDDPTHILTAKFGWATITDYSAAGSWFGIDGDFGDDTPLIGGETGAETTIDDTIDKLRIGVERGGFTTTVVTEYLTYFEISGTGTEPIWIEGEDIECEDAPFALTRPLQATDKLLAFQSIAKTFPFGPETLAHSAVIFAAKSDSMVNAVIDGTITEIETLDPDDCIDLFTPTVDGNIGDPSEARETCRVTLVGDDNQINRSGEFIWLFSHVNNPDTAYLIHIEGDDGRQYLQIATHVEDYAYEGQTVSAGCYLGKALKLPDDAAGPLGTAVGIFNSTVGALIQIFGDLDQPFDALTAVWVLTAPDTYVDAWDEYTVDPSDSAPCNSPEGYEGCMGDTRLEDASQWQSSNGVSWIQPGATMDSGSFIRSTFNLDEDRNPYAIIGGYAIPASNLSVSFGTNKEPINEVSASTSFEIEAGDPDEGAFYTIELKNTGEVPIRVDFICVLHETDRSGNPQGPKEIPPDKLPPDTRQAPGTQICYFTDASFEDGLDKWDSDGDVEEDDGVLLLPDDASISQEDLKLKAGTYNLTVIARPWTNGSYEADDDDDSNGIEIKYAYPDDDTFITVGGMKSWGAYAIKGVLTLKAVVTIASDEDGTFSFKANVVLPPDGVLGVQLMSVCLTKEGQAEGGDGDGLITPTCGAIPTPTLSATAPGTWFTWLWAQSNKFFRCELIRVINAIYGAMTQFFRTCLWSIRWTQAAAIRAGNFANTTLYWLNGHLYNVAVGKVYVVAGEGPFDTSADLGDVLLGGLKSVIDLFISLLQRVIDFVFYLLNLVFTIALDIIVALIRIGILAIGFIIALLGQFFDLINALFFAWNNATPAAIAGVPQCAVEPKENPVCIILWTLENTIFSGRGFLFIPFMVAYGSAELLLWAISRLAKNARESAGSG